MYVSHPLLNPYGKIGSRYPSNVYHGNRLSFPILRQKMALSDVLCLLTAGWLFVDIIRDQNTLTLSNVAE
jgi:hypothetical protein